MEGNLLKLAEGLLAIQSSGSLQEHPHLIATRNVPSASFDIETRENKSEMQLFIDARMPGATYTD